MAVTGVPVAHGEIEGSATAKQFPSIAVVGTVRLRARVGNTGNVYLGLSNAVTVPDSTQDVTTGYELDGGDEIELAVSNLNELWIICDNATDDLTYLILGG